MNTVFPAQVRHCPASFPFLENLDDLGFGRRGAVNLFFFIGAGLNLVFFFRFITCLNFGGPYTLRYSPFLGPVIEDCKLKFDFRHY